MSKSKKPNVQRTVIILVCIMMVFVGAIVSRLMSSPQATDMTPIAQQDKLMETRQALLNSGVFVRPQSQNLTAFSLTDEQGQPFENDRFEGQWSLVFLGFTHCPDLCPTTLALFKQLHDSEQEAQLPNIQYVLLSVDPERDTPQRLDEYLDNFDPDFVGITGSIVDVDRLAKQLDSLFAKVQMEDDYMMDHSTNIIIINPAGQYHGFIRPPHSVEQIKTAMQIIVAAY